MRNIIVIFLVGFILNCCTSEPINKEWKELTDEQKIMFKIDDRVILKIEECFSFIGHPVPEGYTGGTTNIYMPTDLYSIGNEWLVFYVKNKKIKEVRLHGTFYDYVEFLEWHISYVNHSNYLNKNYNMTFEDITDSFNRDLSRYSGRIIFARN